MKITIDIGLDDLLENVYDYESGNYYYVVKDDYNLKNDIIEKIKNEILCNLRYDTYSDINVSVNNLLKECKGEIIDKVVETVSKKIINQKAVKDFKKTLED